MGDRTWSFYTCRSCSGFVVAGHINDANTLVVTEVFPPAKSVPIEVPARARSYLEQALASKRQPSASVVVAASAIDEMLRAVGFAEGTLNASIRKAAEAHRLTPEMVAWANHIRLEANGQRHPKPDEPMPTVADAEQVIEFALALGEYLFVLPARVTRGLGAKPKP